MRNEQISGEAEEPAIGSGVCVRARAERRRLQRAAERDKCAFMGEDKYRFSLLLLVCARVLLTRIDFFSSAFGLCVSFLFLFSAPVLRAARKSMDFMGERLGVCRPSFGARGSVGQASATR